MALYTTSLVATVWVETGRMELPKKSGRWKQGFVSRCDGRKPAEELATDEI